MAGLKKAKKCGEMLLKYESIIFSLLLRRFCPIMYRFTTRTSVIGPDLRCLFGKIWKFLKKANSLYTGRQQIQSEHLARAIFNTQEFKLATSRLRLSIFTAFGRVV